ncbi:MAG: GDSL-type esterase/lipase family protein [Vicinamibacteria bacterium]
MRLQRWLRTLYLLVWASVLGALAAEVLLALERRSARQAADDYSRANVFDAAMLVSQGAGDGVWQERGVRYRPGARLTLEAGGETYEIAINARGFRGPEFAIERPPGVLRVACIGGSTTVQGRTNATTYPALLQALLEAELGRGRLEVLNLGINGARSDHWFSRLDELLGFQPDLLIQYEFVNDLFWAALPRLAAADPWIARRNASLLLAWLLPLDERRLDPDWLELRRTLRAIARVARARGAEYLTATFAGPDADRAEPGFRAYLDVNVEAWSRDSVRLRRYADYDRARRRFNAELASFASDRRLELAPVADRVRDPALFLDLCHGNARGIEALARAFVPEAARLLRPRLATRAVPGGAGGR